MNILEEKYWGVFKKKLVESQWKSYQGKNVKMENKKVMDILLENTKRSIISEGLTTSGNASVVVPVVLGLVKKFFPKLIANEIVSVQPMTKPTSIVKFKKLYFGDYELQNYTGDGLLNDYISTGNPASEFKSLTQAINETVPQGESVLVKLTGAVLPFAGVQKGSVTIQLGDVTKPEVNGVVDFGSVVFEVKHSSGTIVVKNMDTSNPQSISAIVRYNTIQFESNYGETVSRIRYELENIPVVAQTKKLKASWTYEFLEDVQQELGDMMNFEEEVFNDISALIAQEINREILSDLIVGQKSVGHELSWDYKAPTESTMLTQEAYFRTLLHRINEMAGKITRATKRFEPNFIVVSPFMRQVLQNGLAQYEFRPSDTDTVDYSQVGFAFSGTISGRYDLYVTPSIPDNQILVGYKGSSLVDSGYVFAPYVPLKQVPVTHESTPGMLFYTRNGKQMYAPWYYGVVTINDLI